MSISPTKLILTKSLETKLLCPTKPDSQITLIRERISTPKCEQRQVENFHKCHQCIYHTLTPNK